MDDRRHQIDQDTRRFFEGVLFSVGFMILIVALCLVVARAVQAQALVDMTRYDAVRGRQEIACYLDSLQYTNATAVIRCHSDADAIFGNGFEALPCD